jgi:hypothetical protein
VFLWENAQFVTSGMAAFLCRIPPYTPWPARIVSDDSEPRVHERFELLGILANRVELHFDSVNFGGANLDALPAVGGALNSQVIVADANAQSQLNSGAGFAVEILSLHWISRLNPELQPALLRLLAMIFY